MSDRLALSASMSVLMMAIYVLFGTDAARAPMGADAGEGLYSVSAPELALDPSRLLPTTR